MICTRSAAFPARPSKSSTPPASAPTPSNRLLLSEPRPVELGPDRQAVLAHDQLAELLLHRLELGPRQRPERARRQVERHQPTGIERQDLLLDPLLPQRLERRRVEAAPPVIRLERMGLETGPLERRLHQLG